MIEDLASTHDRPDDTNSLITVRPRGRAAGGRRAGRSGRARAIMRLAWTKRTGSAAKFMIDLAG
ncbi:hypothetical protein BFV98_11775 [Micromonospora sp. WMMB235]|nr:hypothetical protein BFV98_11775 [Micromonospora sp. WMMB235]